MFAINQIYQYHKHSVMLRSQHSHSLENVDTDSMLKGDNKLNDKSSFADNHHQATFGNSQQHFGIDKTHIQEDERNLTFGEEGQEGTLPEIIHIFTKRDRTGFEGYKRQKETVDQLQKEGVIDKYFFVSSIERKFGMAELKEHIMESPSMNYLL